MKPLKILMLNYEFPPLGGGSSPVTLHLGRELVRRGHRVDLVTMGMRGLPREEEVEGIRVRRVPCLRLRRDRCTTPEMITYVLAARSGLVAQVRREKYDVNHTHFIFPTGLLARRLKQRTGLPYLLTSHGSDVPGYNPDRFKLLHRLLMPLWRGIVREAELVTTPSADHGTLVRSHAPTARIVPVPNGIDPDEFVPDRPKRPIILGSGRLFPRKNYHTLIAALAGLPAPWELVLVGEGTERARLEALARQHAVPLRITGWLDRRGAELKELFETASIFVLPSLRESFGMVVAEAMAAGQAVVTTATGGPAEVAGECGVAVEAEDVAGMRKAVFDLIADEDRRLELGKMGAERARGEFAWPVVAERFEALYREVSTAAVR